MEDTALSIEFCKGAVNYDIAVPEPQNQDEKSVQALVRKQDRAATTAYFTHLNGLGKDAWEYPNPQESDDDCIKTVWKMVCYTYFPRAEAGCGKGRLMEYIRPCKSSCENYIKACSVECCDESVQCVFDHPKHLTKTTVLATSGYEPHDGPSTFCTGSAHHSSVPSFAILLASFFAIGSDFGSFGFQNLGRARHFLLAVTVVCLSLMLQGCDGAMVHSLGNWRQADDYLVKFQFVPPGASSKEAVLNSCSLPGLSPTLQCSGHGGCHAWEKTSDANPTPFCKCDSDWADPECRTRRKSQTVAYFLATFLGIVGADRFYLGLLLSGWLKLALLGGLSVFCITEILITGSSPVNLNKDLRSWSGLMKVITFLVLGSAFGKGWRWWCFFQFWVKKTDHILIYQESKLFGQVLSIKYAQMFGFICCRPNEPPFFCCIDFRILDWFFIFSVLYAPEFRESSFHRTRTQVCKPHARHEAYVMDRL